MILVLGLLGKVGLAQWEASQEPAEERNKDLACSQPSSRPGIAFAVALQDITSRAQCQFLCRAYQINTKGATRGMSFLF